MLEKYGLLGRIVKSLCIIASILILPTTSFAWGEDGHHVVWVIAQQYLNPKARAAVKHLREGSSIKDREIPNWADYIRSSAEYGRKYKNHPLWHYINIEVKTKREEVKRDYWDFDVIGGIERFSRIMIDPSIAKDDRKEAFFFVTHFIGDFHQPLHTCNRDDDKGGNLVLIRSFRGVKESRLNLHKVWDTNLVKAELGDLNAEDYAKRLISEITAEQREKWSKGDVRDWIWDSHEIALKTIYWYSDKSVLPDTRDKAEIELTDENYVKKNLPVVREQLKKGGIRLAKHLNDLYP